MSNYYPEEEEEDLGVSLIDQLGTDPQRLARGELDKAKLGVIMDSSDIPDTFPALLYLQTRASLTNARWARVMVESYLDLTVGVRGRGRIDAIKGESVKRGIGVDGEPRTASPSFIERYVTNRKKAREYDREREELGLE